MSHNGAVKTLKARMVGKDGSRQGTALDPQSTAALPGLRVPFVAEKRIGMFDGHRAESGFVRDKPLGGKLASTRIDFVCNIVPNLPVKLQIGGKRRLFDGWKRRKSAGDSTGSPEPR